MPMKRCDQGHFYDDRKHTTCPFCGIPNLNVQSTVMLKRDAETLPDTHDGKTVGMLQRNHAIDPVVGWLACVVGTERGRSYTLKSERNFIGRSPQNEVCILGDDGISRDNHATVSYNPRNNSFKISPGEGRGLLYLNGQEVFTPQDLVAYDKLELGSTTLIFIPLCGEMFMWTE